MYVSELEPVLDEWRALVGERRGQVWQPQRHSLVIELGGHLLMIATQGQFARMHRIAQRPAQPKKPFSFQGACRAHLSGVLTGIRCLAPNRAVELQFGTTCIHLRLFGRGKLWLVKGDSVLAALDGPTPATLDPLGSPPAHQRAARFPIHSDHTWAANDAAEQWFSEQIQKALERDLRASVRRRLMREQQRIQRLVHALERDFEATGKAPLLRRQADALAASLHLLDRSQSVARVADLLEPDTLLEVRLDPRLTPAENMNRLYKKAGRLDRAAERVLDRMDREERRLVELTAAATEIENLPLGDLRRWSKQLPGDRSSTPAPSHPDWDTWDGPLGMTLRVGRNSRGNRALCFSVSKGRDWWFHLRDKPGAHVILRSNPPEAPPLEAMLAAAEEDEERLARIAAGGFEDEDEEMSEEEIELE